MLRKALVEKGAALNVRETILLEKGIYQGQGLDYPMYIIPEK